MKQIYSARWNPAYNFLSSWQQQNWKLNPVSIVGVKECGSYKIHVGMKVRRIIGNIGKESDWVVGCSFREVSITENLSKISLSGGKFFFQCQCSKATYKNANEKQQFVSWISGCHM